MKELGNLFDPYERQARLFPAVLTLAPALLLVLAVFPSAGLSEFPKGFVAALLLLALCYVLAGLARAAGKRVQQELYAQWRGEPTTSMLRHRDATLNPITKKRYHDVLSAMFGVPWPSLEDEVADPIATDVTYSSSVDMLRNRRRGDAHRLVLVESTAYGFRRNMYGLKIPATVIAIACATVAAAMVLVQLNGCSSSGGCIAKMAGDYRYVLVLVVNLVVAVAWLALVRKCWVKQAAHDYARALLGSLDTETASG